MRTGGFLFLFCLSKRLRGFLSPFFPPFGVFGCVLFGYVLSLSLLLSLSSVGASLPAAASLSRSRSLSLSSEEGNGTTF